MSRHVVEIGQGEQIHGCSMRETVRPDYAAIAVFPETSG
jgi:hypothetical protein